MQLQGELSSSAEKQYKGILHALRVIFQNEGIRGIQKGIVPGVWYQVFMNGSRLGSYGPIKRILNAEPELPFFTLKNILAGSLAGELCELQSKRIYTSLFSHSFFFFFLIFHFFFFSMFLF